MNPYLNLLDDPVRLEAAEHTGEVLSGGGVPWGSDPPRFSPPARNGLRDRLAELSDPATIL